MTTFDSKRMERINREGLTWREWQDAARADDTQKTRNAWARGEDPTEWRARK